MKNHRLWNFARKVRPRAELMVISARNLTNPISPLPAPDGIRFVRIDRVEDAHFEHLMTIATVMRLTRESMMTALRDGQVAWLAMDDSSDQPEPAAIAWTSFKDDIRELSETFLAGGGNGYFYYDFVRPEFRGRGLQKHLIDVRLVDAAQRGAKWAYTYIDRRNTPSLKSYFKQGFIEIARSNSFTMAGFGVTRLRTASDPNATAAANSPSVRNRILLRRGKK